MRIRTLRAAVSAVCLTSLFTLGAASSSAQVVTVDQGRDWTPDRQRAYYTQDQGSRIMPLSWMRALVLPDGTGFLADALDRYGYLPMPGRDPADLPAGFTTGAWDGETHVGMTCSACHTRQITVNGLAYRIDGGPAMVDFQSFLKDLNDAVGAALASNEAFDAFAGKVVGATASDAVRADLKSKVQLWHKRFDTLIDRALPTPAWGPGRLDAVSMIFNRLSGLDIGSPPDFLIPDNIKRADAPTRYPFLWNAPRQSKTQWPGFADNGSDLLALARNLGQVYGVFAIFHPVEQSGLFRLNRDYLKTNSANFRGLARLEDLVWDLGPPKWPWEIDKALAKKGQAIFARPGENSGGCIDCHGIRPGPLRGLNLTWATPRQDVGTDRRECEIMMGMVDTGTMNGAKIPFGDRLKPRDLAINVLSTAVKGAIIQNITRFRSSRPELEVAARGGRSSRAARLPSDMSETAQEIPPQFDELRGAFPNEVEMRRSRSESRSREASASAKPCEYEARVLEGIWAAAPYLHNGSVATLKDLLEPAASRKASFKLGPAYDIENVGLAEQQTKFDFTLETTDCSDLSSGRSRCGHEYGATTLSADEKRALLEYLKTL